MDKEHTAMERLRLASDMSLRLYKQPLMLTDSGGKDSAVICRLADNAGIPFEIVHSHTTADAPETVYHVRKRAEDCGQGIHMTTLGWSAVYGRDWGDIALLELEADADEIVVPLYETGKVRAPKALVIREVPLEEAGIMGKILAKRRAE